MSHTCGIARSLGARQQPNAEQPATVDGTDCLVALPERGDERERQREHDQLADAGDVVAVPFVVTPWP